MMKVDYLIYMIGATVSYLNVALIYSKITNTKFKINLFNIILLAIMGILNAYITIHLPIAVKPIYNLVCFGVAIRLSSKETFKGIIYYTFAIWLIGILLDILFMALFSIAFNYLLKLWPKWGILIISLSLQVLLNLLFRIKRLKNRIVIIKEKIFLIKNIIWMFLLTIFVVLLFGIFAFKNLSSLGYVSLFIYLLILTIILIGFLLKILFEEKTYKITIDNLLNNNSYYLELSNESRVFKHNLIHNLNSLKTVSNSKTNTLIDDLINEYNSSKESNVNVENLPNGINGLICKMIYSNNKKLNVVTNNYLKSNLFDVLTPRKYNKLYETIGVCLDNAISASIKSKEKILQIVITEDDSSVVVKIANTFESSLEIDKIGNIDYTTKRSGHGLGLYSLFSKKNVRLKTSIINNIFENQIIVRKIK